MKNSSIFSAVSLTTLQQLYLLDFYEKTKLVSINFESKPTVEDIQDIVNINFKRITNLFYYA
jgi:hypothetical protein